MSLDFRLETKKPLSVNFVREKLEDFYELEVLIGEDEEFLEGFRVWLDEDPEFIVEYSLQDDNTYWFYTYEYEILPLKQFLKISSDVAEKLGLTILDSQTGVENISPADFKNSKDIFETAKVQLSILGDLGISVADTDLDGIDLASEEGEEDEFGEAHVYGPDNPDEDGNIGLDFLYENGKIGDLTYSMVEEVLGDEYDVEELDNPAEDGLKDFFMVYAGKVPLIFTIPEDPEDQAEINGMSTAFNIEELTDDEVSEVQDIAMEIAEKLGFKCVVGLF